VTLPGDPSVRPEVARWFARRTSRATDWPADRLLAAKRDTSVSVVLPALDEEETVGDIVAVLTGALVGPGGLVDEVVVVDSGSSDRTAQFAEAAGARVVHAGQALPAVPPVTGKGEAMWRSLAATTGDVLVFCDADLRDVSPAWVTGLLGPLLLDPGTAFVKATYDRPLDTGHTVLPAGGGRVTEVLARPLLNLFWPALAGFVQPLAGEYAARRSLLERLPFPCGYGVELGLLVDTLRVAGLDAMAQVDLGERRHRHRDDRDLGRMAGEILQTALARLRAQGRVSADEPASDVLAQFTRDGDAYRMDVADTGGVERPPVIGVPGYAAARWSAS